MVNPLDVRNAVTLLAAAADLALETPAGRRPARAAAPPGSLPPAVTTLVATPRLRTARRTASAARRPRAGRAPIAGYAPQAASTRAAARSSGTARSSSSSSSHDPLAFLKDKRLSIEEKLVKLLGYLNAQWEKELQQKLDAIAAGEAKKKASSSGSSGSSSKKKSGGLLGALGGLGDVVQAFVAPATAALKVPAVQEVLSQVGGPVLAAGVTALGFPELAPLALKYGPELVKGATSLLGALDGGSAASSGGSGASGGSTGASGGATGGSAAAASDADRQTLLLEIQRIQQKQQEMLGLVSNVLKTGHDARLAVISNIR
jgi:hypothetical protein